LAVPSGSGVEELVHIECLLSEEHVVYGIDIVGDVAIAVCPFFIVYELDGKVHRESGRDVLVFSRTARGWSVVWRTMQVQSTEKSAG